MGLPSYLKKKELELKKSFKTGVFKEEHLSYYHSLGDSLIRKFFGSELESFKLGTYYSKRKTHFIEDIKYDITYKLGDTKFLSKEAIKCHYNLYMHEAYDQYIFR